MHIYSLSQSKFKFTTNLPHTRKIGIRSTSELPKTDAVEWIAFCRRMLRQNTTIKRKERASAPFFISRLHSHRASPFCLPEKEKKASSSSYVERPRESLTEERSLTGRYPAWITPACSGHDAVSKKKLSRHLGYFTVVTATGERAARPL